MRVWRLGEQESEERVGEASLILVVGMVSKRR